MPEPDTSDAERAMDSMIATIEDEAAATAVFTGRSRLAERVIAAIRSVPRHLFVPEEERSLAYADRPLPIGHRQTISQPFMVALMTDLLDIAPGDRVLEIGTGSGYQAAVLARLAAAVFSIERVGALADMAARRLAGLGFTTVKVRAGDGFAGWPEEAAFDAIVVTAASDHVPPALVAQLRPGGRMVIPIGSVPHHQSLRLIRKDDSGDVHDREVLAVAFVPMLPGTEPAAVRHDDARVDG